MLEIANESVQQVVRTPGACAAAATLTLAAAAPPMIDIPNSRRETGFIARHDTPAAVKHKGSRLHEIRRGFMDEAHLGPVAGASPKKIRLDSLLVQRGLVESREKSRALILAGQVDVGGHGAEKAGTMVPIDADVRVIGPDHPWVSRGGIKLAHALDVFGLDVRHVRALDVGASTGGFTASKVSQ